MIAELFIVCSTIFSYSGGEYISNAKPSCEIVNGQRLAERVDNIYRSAYKVNIEIYRAQKIKYEIKRSTESQIITVPRIEFQP